MRKQINQVEEFHRAFKQPIRTEPCPFDDSDENMKDLRFRGRLMLEEVKEWITEANYNADIDKRAKELADILYVVFGTIITEGLQGTIELVFDEVHKSNMTKMPYNQIPIISESGKILKPSTYKEPDLSLLKTFYSK